MKTSESIAVATVRLFEAVNSPFLWNPRAAPKISISARNLTGAQLMNFMGLRPGY